MNEKTIARAGRFLYGFSIVVVGVHQIIIRDFRPEVLPPFPAWAHTQVIFPILFGIVLISAGILVAISSKIDACLFLGYLFLALVITCHLPYVLFLSPTNATHLVVWFDLGEALA